MTDDQTLNIYNDELLIGMFTRIHHNIKICDECGAPAKKCCSRCNWVWYCKKACQNKSWKNGHKYVCRIIKQVKQKHIDLAVELDYPEPMGCCLNCITFRVIVFPLSQKRLCCVCKKYCKRKCPNCKKAYFCDTDCQQEGWKTHKIACDFIASLDIENIKTLAIMKNLEDSVLATVSDNSDC